MSKNLSAKFYQENKKKDCKKRKLVKDIKIFLKKKTKKKSIIWSGMLQKFLKR